MVNHLKKACESQVNHRAPSHVARLTIRRRSIDLGGFSRRCANRREGRLGQRANRVYHATPMLNLSPPHLPRPVAIPGDTVPRHSDTTTRPVSPATSGIPWHSPHPSWFPGDLTCLLDLTFTIPIGPRKACGAIPCCRCISVPEQRGPTSVILVYN
jgi:hypothetical protein